MRFIKKYGPYILAGTALIGTGAYLVYRNSQKNRTSQTVSQNLNSGQDFNPMDDLIRYAQELAAKHKPNIRAVEPTPDDIPLRAHHLQRAVQYLMTRGDFRDYEGTIQGVDRMLADGLKMMGEMGTLNLGNVNVEEMGHPQGLGDFMEGLYTRLYEENSPVRVVDTDDAVCKKCRSLKSRPPCVAMRDIQIVDEDLYDSFMPKDTPAFEKRIASGLGVEIGKTYRFRDVVDELARNGKKVQELMMKRMNDSLVSTKPSCL